MVKTVNRKFLSRILEKHRGDMALQLLVEEICRCKHTCIQKQLKVKAETILCRSGTSPAWVSHQ